jgi:hypothetical protein
VRSLDLVNSEVTITVRPPVSEHGVLGLGKLTVAIEVLLDAEAPTAAGNARATTPKRSGGYQADKANRAFDQLVEEGERLSDLTKPQLRKRMLEKIPERRGEALPSRGTLNRVIERRLSPK